MFKKIIISVTAVGILASLFAISSLSANQTPGQAIAASDIYALEDGSFLIADDFQKSIWIMYQNGDLEKLAGDSSVLSELSGYPAGGNQDGAALEASFASPWDIVSYGNGYVISDTENASIRYLDLETATVSTLELEVQKPTGMVALEDGSILVADAKAHVIKQLDVNGELSVYAGKENESGIELGDLEEARFNEPTGLYYVEGALYIADSANHRICKIVDGQVSQVAGKAGVEGYEDGNFEDALFSWPINIVEQDGVLYVADYGNASIRSIDGEEVTTFLEAGSLEDGLAPISPKGLGIIENELWIGDVFSRVLYSVPLP